MVHVRFSWTLRLEQRETEIWVLYVEDVRAPNYVHDRLLLPTAEKQKVFLDQHLKTRCVRKIPKSIVKRCFSLSSLFRTTGCCSKKYILFKLTNTYCIYFIDYSLVLKDIK